MISFAAVLLFNGIFSTVGKPQPHVPATSEDNSTNQPLSDLNQVGQLDKSLQLSPNSVESKSHKSNDTEILPRDSLTLRRFARNVLSPCVKKVVTEHNNCRKMEVTRVECKATGSVNCLSWVSQSNPSPSCVPSKLDIFPGCPPIVKACKCAGS